MSSQAGPVLFLAPKEPKEVPGLSGQCPWDESDSCRGPTRGSTIPAVADWLQVLKPLCAKKSLPGDMVLTIQIGPQAKSRLGNRVPKP